ncbi:VOC family protein [Albimonas pacifica]|uniref:Glyoxalase family protein n=1 Tax=Albimonas pacifica TaxID=1114924 RepID=A0A1I3GYV4_9RHOB|nr:VOC family protein [Albimonas pacifica]SFI28561.1 glyoxalase family protein [Albimonas pacifica]
MKINGLHHVTALASGARENNAFYTHALGLRRVKKTVNFDAPDTYHLYYGDELGRPGTAITYFPFAGIGKGAKGAGTTSEVAYSIPLGAADWWAERLDALGVPHARRDGPFGETGLNLAGPDGEAIALVEVADDPREGWTGGGVEAAHAIRGFHGVTLTLRETARTQALLETMGYAVAGVEGARTRLKVANGNGADVVDLVADAEAPRAIEGAGSVHHIAFSVPDREAQDEARRILTQAGAQITPPIDRDYFWAIYFRTPGGVLFEIATAEPGFDRDEAPEALGTALKLPRQHERLRSRIEEILEPIDA